MTLHTSGITRVPDLPRKSDSDDAARRENAIQDMIARGYTRERAIEVLDFTLGAFFKRWDSQ